LSPDTLLQKAAHVGWFAGVGLSAVNFASKSDFDSGLMSGRSPALFPAKARTTGGDLQRGGCEPEGASSQVDLELPDAASSPDNR